MRAHVARRVIAWGIGLVALSVLAVLVIGEPVLRHLATHRWVAASLDVAYRYEFEGRAFHSTRLDLFHARALGDRVELTRLAATFRPGESTACFVNPRDPEQAILIRELPPGLARTLAIATVPALIPAAVGLSFLWASYAKRQKARAC